MSSDGPVYRVRLTGDVAAGLQRVARTAERWGAGWQMEGLTGGRLALPVMAGLRRGRVAGTVSVERTAEGSQLTFRVERQDYTLEKAAVALLSIAALGASAVLLAPFFPRLMPLIPSGALLMLAAWLFVVARLRNSGPEEFLADLASDDAGEGAECS